MRTIGLILTTVTVGAALALPQAAHAGAAASGAVRERLQQIVELRKMVAEFYIARRNGDRDAAMTAADNVRAAWNKLPKNIQAAIEEKHPGTADRIANLKAEFDEDTEDASATTVQKADTWTKDTGTVAHDGTRTGTAGGTVTSHDVWTKDGNTVTRDGTVTGPGGKTATRDDTFVKDGNVVTLNGTTTLPSGKEITREGTWTKDDNTITAEKTVTLPDGKVIEKDATITKDGDTVTRDAVATLPNGQTVTSKDTWVREGNTIEHEGTSEGPRGTTTRESTTVIDGNTATRDGTVTRPSGTAVDHHDVYVRDGNTITHDGTATVNRATENETPAAAGAACRSSTAASDTTAGTPRAAERTVNAAAAKKWEPNYKDNYDIFGCARKSATSAVNDADAKKRRNDKATKAKEIEKKNVGKRVGANK
jgi:hypothetical protein